MSLRKGAGEHVLHYDTFLFKNKFKALNALLHRAEYTITRSIFVSMPKNLAWTEQQVDSTCT